MLFLNRLAQRVLKKLARISLRCVTQPTPVRNKYITYDARSLLQDNTG